jgi:hypothetical protein
MADNYVVPACKRHEDRCDFEVFDSLPPAARAAFRDSLEDWKRPVRRGGSEKPGLCAGPDPYKGELWDRRFNRMAATGPYSGCAPVSLDRLIEVDHEWNHPTPERKRRTG